MLYWQVVLKELRIQIWSKLANPFCSFYSLLHCFLQKKEAFFLSTWVITGKNQNSSLGKGNNDILGASSSLVKQCLFILSTGAGCISSSGRLCWMMWSWFAWEIKFWPNAQNALGGINQFPVLIHFGSFRDNSWTAHVTGSRGIQRGKGRYEGRNPRKVIGLSIMTDHTFLGIQSHLWLTTGLAVRPNQVRKQKSWRAFSALPTPLSHAQT